MMKKLLSLLLALCMMLSCVLLLSACDKKEDDDKEKLKVDAPTGTKAWSNADIGFAYPSTWEKNQIAGVLFSAQSPLGSNVNVASESKKDVYMTMTNDNFMSIMGPTFEMVGATITNANVVKKKTANGVDMVAATFKNTMATQGVTVTVWQTQFYVNTANKTYAVTVTGRNQSEMQEAANIVAATIVAAK